MLNPTLSYWIHFGKMYEEKKWTTTTASKEKKITHNRLPRWDKITRGKCVSRIAVGLHHCVSKTMLLPRKIYEGNNNKNKNNKQQQQKTMAIDYGLLFVRRTEMEDDDKNKSANESMGKNSDAYSLFAVIEIVARPLFCCFFFPCSCYYLHSTVFFLAFLLRLLCSASSLDLPCALFPYGSVYP